MIKRESYLPGPAAGAEVRMAGEKWTLVIVRDFRHPPVKVWQALTDPAHLREWSPFDADGSLATAATVMLTTVGAPGPHVTECIVKHADAPSLLEYDWGGSMLRWELESRGNHTRVTLRQQDLDRGFLSWGAAGWHICFDVLERFLDGEPIGRIAGPETLKFEGWQRLNAEYAKQFGTATSA